MRNDEAMAIERALGCDFGVWSQRVMDGNIGALTGLVWILRRRNDSQLRYDNVRFKLGSVGFEMTDDEVIAVREALKSDPAKLAEFDQNLPADQLERARAVPTVAATDSPDAAASTSDGSP